MEPVDGNGVAWLDREGDFGREMRRRLDLGVVHQDQPVDIAARRQRELPDLALVNRQLLRVVERRLSRSGRWRVLRESARAKGEGCISQE